MAKSGKAIAKLREFGYAFNEVGQLRKIDKTTGETTEEPYIFKISDNDEINQRHYEDLANQIPEIVYILLEQQGLTRKYILGDASSEHASFVFVQPCDLNHSNKLLVLIHGSGYVRAGQWARRLIINNSLNEGTQLPYIKRAQALGYDILVLNTNQTAGDEGAALGINTPFGHAEYVWKNIVLPSQPEKVAIVAHSYGGAVTMMLAKKFKKFFEQHVFAIALTDSVRLDVPEAVRDHIPLIARNWASSTMPLDTELAKTKKKSNEVVCVSAGHPEHEFSSHAAFESVFTFLKDQYKEKLK